MNAPSPERNTLLEPCRRLHDVLVSRDEAALRVLTSDFVWHTPAYGCSSDAEGLKTFAAMLWAAFPDLHFVPAESVVSGGDDRVALLWRFDGTQQGTLLDWPATGKPVMVTGISILRVHEGRIAEMWHSWGEMGLWQQLDAMPILL